MAREVLAVLTPVCVQGRLLVAGSLRRKLARVGDVDLVLIPRKEDRQLDLLTRGKVDLAAEAIEQLVDAGVLAKQPSVEGTFTWGPRNKLAVHVASGIQVDFFLTDEACWWNTVVCRTGPVESNRRIIEAARAKEWTWKPYGPGFVAGDCDLPVRCEEDAFKLVDLPFLPPDQR